MVEQVVDQRFVIFELLSFAKQTEKVLKVVAAGNNGGHLDLDTGSRGVDPDVLIRVFGIWVQRGKDGFNLVYCVSGSSRHWNWLKSYACLFSAVNYRKSELFGN